MPSSPELTVATAEIGRGMIECAACPCCGGTDLKAVSCPNDLHAMAAVSDSMKDSDYHVCLDCSVIFARRRQSLESAALFYRWFAHLERRDYAVYPPTANYIRVKADASAAHLRYLADRGVLSPGMTVAHIRCDVGSLLAQLQDRFPGCTVHGWDYFDSNVRYAREQGLDGVDLLDPACLNLRNGTAYDLIICNHIFTHALDPVADLQRLHSALKPGGVLFLYNEVDHFLRFQPKGPFFQWVALNNFHKQLLSPESLTYFLTTGGFSIEAREHRKFYMQVLARRNAGDAVADDKAAIAKAAKDVVPVMLENFQRWAVLRDNPFLGLIKTTSKLRRALGGR